MEKYSVLTTLYAKEKPEYLRQCLDSMLNQSVNPSEYVIVKDGPLTAELDLVLAEYKEKYPIIKIIELESNSGCGIASIKGMEACTYDLVARIDSDDISMANRCELELQMFEKEPDLAVVGTDLIEFADDPDQIVAIKRMPTDPEEIYRYGKMRNPINHSTVMMRKSIIQANGGYAPLRRSLDLELFTKLLINGCKCRNIGEPLVKFRTGSARVARKKNWTNLKCDLEVYKRNFREDYITFFEYCYIVFRQLIFFILPCKLAGFLYMRIYRDKV